MLSQRSCVMSEYTSQILRQTPRGFPSFTNTWAEYCWGPREELSMVEIAQNTSLAADCGGSDLLLSMTLEYHMNLKRLSCTYFAYIPVTCRIYIELGALVSSHD